MASLMGRQHTSATPLTLTFREDLVSLCFTDALDGTQDSLWSESNALDGEVACF